MTLRVARNSRNWRPATAGVWSMAGCMSPAVAHSSRRCAVCASTCDVERALEPHPAVCVELPDALGVVAEAPADEVRASVMRATGLAWAAVRVVEAPVPRLDNGKVDRAGAGRSAVRDRGPAVGGNRQEQLLAAYSRLLGVPAVAGDSFRGLGGGDSMSCIAVSIEVERILGFLPDRWHEQSVETLALDRRPVGEDGDICAAARSGDLDGAWIARCRHRHSRRNPPAHGLGRVQLRALPDR